MATLSKAEIKPPCWFKIRFLFLIDVVLCVSFFRSFSSDLNSLYHFALMHCSSLKSLKTKLCTHSHNSPTCLSSNKFKSTFLSVGFAACSAFSRDSNWIIFLRFSLLVFFFFFILHVGKKTDTGESRVKSDGKIFDLIRVTSLLSWAKSNRR